MEDKCEQIVAIGIGTKRRAHTETFVIVSESMKIAQQLRQIWDWKLFDYKSSTVAPWMS